MFRDVGKTRFLEESSFARLAMNSNPLGIPVAITIPDRLSVYRGES
jgi:hypothetical protein